MVAVVVVSAIARKRSEETFMFQTANRTSDMIFGFVYSMAAIVSFKMAVDGAD